MTRAQGWGHLVVDVVLVDAVIDVVGTVVRWRLDPRWLDVKKPIQHPRRDPEHASPVVVLTARHVEVPFAVRLDHQAEAHGPVVLRGVIDLVHQSDNGWRILDYKSDQLDGIADVDAELLVRYGPQLAQYKSAWEQATGGKVASSDLVALRAKRTISVR